MSEENTCASGQTENSLENSPEYDPAGSVSQPEGEEEAKKQLSADTYYKYEELHSRPIITAGSDIPENLLHLSHSFGYDSQRRSNLKLLDDRTLLFIAGNLLVLLDVPSGEQRYRRSCSGGGIGAITAHPSRGYFVVAEKGNHPNIIIYEYPTLRPYRVLRGGTERQYSFVDFNRDGTLLASVGAAPDYMLTLWDWMQEEVMLSCKAVSQEVYRVSFSPHDPGLLTTSGSGHIKFWKMASTFTGLKLQGVMGHFGKTVATDIEGYVELPDGKVLSGTEWGNLLLWDGNAIRAEICRKEGRSCHVGTVQPFALEDGQLMTFGSDGVVRGWDFERITAAEGDGGSGRFELEPINEMMVGHDVCLSSVVRSSLPDSFLWFAQDSNGAIWKLDLSFTNTTPDPECLFSFHAGVIQGLDVSKKSHLVATTALDRSVRVFDFLSKQELTTSRFNQGGTALTWAPPSVNQSGALLVTGFEDGVVRILELYNPHRLQAVTGQRPEGDAKLRLRQAFKPHTASVTAVAYERDGEILATGSADCTVFFFAVGESYQPIGFIQVPGPVQSLEWSPRSHVSPSDSRLLVLCQNGHVVEVHSPDPEVHKSHKTFQMSELPRRSFRFTSIKSRIKREEELRRRQAEKDKKRKAREKQQEASEQHDAGQEEEEEDDDEEGDLPPVYIPEAGSPLCCGFYSQPGQFWLSMGGFDSGYLYHCKFSENQDEDPHQRQDEPFDFLLVQNADEDPVCSITFSSSGQLLLCGMHSGAIRVYPLEPGDHRLASMQSYWSLNIHDNHYGHLRHVRCSHDDLFVLTAGDDGNVFSFSLLPPEELQASLQRRRAKVPSPRVGVESESLALDIEDPAAYSIETAKQKLENEQLCREAEVKVAEKQKKLAELQKRFRQVLNDNESLPEHVRLKPEELQLDGHFHEQGEKLKAQQLMEVSRQFAWEQERISIALRKLQNWFKDSLEATVVTVVAIRSDHRVSTYRLASLAEPQSGGGPQSAASQPDGGRDAAADWKKSRAEPPRDSSKAEERDILHPTLARPAKIKLGDRQEERLKKAAEKAELARMKIEKRKQEWAKIYAEKPKEDYEDPQDLQAIREARENIRDFTAVKHQRANTERKREELLALEQNIREKQVEINRRILALRDSKVHLVSRLHAQAQRLQDVQQRLAARLHRPPPSLPTMLPEETPEKRLQCSHATLERYRGLRDRRLKMLREEEDEEGAVSILEQLEIEMKTEEGDKWSHAKSASSLTREEETPDDGAELSELEEELQREEEIRLLHEQNSLLEQMEGLVRQFDTELLKARGQKLRTDYRLKLAALRALTLHQETLVLKQFDRRKKSLLEKLNVCVEEESSITSKLEQCNQQMELRRREMTKLEKREKSLVAAFQASVGENSKFEEILTKVFRKKVKRVKNDQTVNEGEEDDSDEEEDDEWDDDFDSDAEQSGAALNDGVCPPGCEPELFENTLRLRESRLDLEELMLEEKKTIEALKRESDTLIKKEKLVKINRKAAEDDLEIINKETQQKLDELDVVVPLRLHQIEFVANGAMPLDLSEALVLNGSELSRLQDHIQQLQEEKLHEEDLCRQAHQRHAKLIHDRRDMAAKIQELEKQCSELMMTKFGRLVDLESLQTLSGNRRLEELKHEKLLKEDAFAKEIQDWDVKVEEAQQALMEVTQCNTEHLRCMTDILEEKKELELQVSARQKKMGRQQFQDYRRCVDQEESLRLQELVKAQSQRAEALRREIHLLSCQGGHVLPPDQDWLYGHAPLPTPSGNTPSGRR
ncbi:cilia- and flagella-associated protein 44 [Salarias fasciatus]|uniref:cilia- and flagella-associated protein 44 n=1 Tax=Salarias fasciatus TaxID=181472 RepID=UPI001176982F|nr:cilia- and flagella-associated protein 44 [Salarias fasciatus]